MYLDRMVDENIGPIERLEIEFPFSEEGLPKPVVFVGENGSGKSTALSTIVDSFYTIASHNYDDAMKESDHGNGQQYFKTISPTEIKIGKKYMFSFIRYKGETATNYVFKSGQISDEEFTKKCGMSFSWGDNNNFKEIKPVLAEKEDPFKNNVIVYYGPDRYERPFWMGDKYNLTSEFLHPSISKNWARILKNPITVNNVTEENLQWLLDIIADSRPDVQRTKDGYSIVHTDTGAMDLFCSTRSNLEKIMSNIIGKEIFFALNSRNSGPSRFKIVEKDTNTVIAPTLDSLSTGQIALFNLFSTIVRYSDRNNAFKSVSLSSITGVVVIDEIELHLHSNLQREVLPHLMNLFPRIQFVLTSHSPLFLLGMEEVYGADGYEIREMPTGSVIGPEVFSEFQKAYDYIKNTRTYQEDIISKINSYDTSPNPLIITEGPSDWMHMETAFEVLSREEKNRKVFDNLSFSFFKYSTKKSENSSLQILDMGKDNLTTLCKAFSKIPKNQKFIFIADRDNEETNKKLSANGEKFKYWGNNVYSFIIPIPHFRIKTPQICIEHLYSDEEIKTEVEIEGYNRRLFIGSEFDSRGVATSIDRICENNKKCGCNSIEIIEGSAGEKVTKLSNDNGINYALSKVNFAKYVNNHRDDFKFDSFLEIFKIIRLIVLGDNLEETESNNSISSGE